VGNAPPKHDEVVIKPLLEEGLALMRGKTIIEDGEILKK
jgi:hypothetical protein